MTQEYIKLQDNGVVCMNDSHALYAGAQALTYFLM